MAQLRRERTAATRPTHLPFEARGPALAPRTREEVRDLRQQKGSPAPRVRASKGSRRRTIEDHRRTQGIRGCRDQRRKGGRVMLNDNLWLIHGDIMRGEDPECAYAADL